MPYVIVQGGIRKEHEQDNFRTEVSGLKRKVVVVEWN